MRLPEWVKTYGGPSDPFVRVEERYSVTPCDCGCGGYHLRIERKVLARGPIHKLAINGKVTA